MCDAARQVLCVPDMGIGVPGVIDGQVGWPSADRAMSPVEDAVPDRARQKKKNPPSLAGI